MYLKSVSLKEGLWVVKPDLLQAALDVKVKIPFQEG